MEYDYLELLMYIAKKAGVFKVLETSTILIAKDLKTSQQTVSRKLRDMEKIGMITRLATQKGLEVEISGKGRELLKKHYQELSKIFADKEKLIGVVSAGVGEGKYYVNLPGYQDQFKSKLGFFAYPGTLNVCVAREDALEFISMIEPVIVGGFKTKERSFGMLTCYKVKLDDVTCAIIVPERTRHGNDTLEVISSINLRKRFGLKDGAKVNISR